MPVLAVKQSGSTQELKTVTEWEQKNPKNIVV